MSQSAYVKQYEDRFNTEFDQETNKRNISGIEVVVHCHQQNTRLHKMLDDANEVEGKHIIRSVAEKVFSTNIKTFFQPDDQIDDKWELAKECYSHMGFGNLDFSKLGNGLVESDSSHFVEGWQLSFPTYEEPVCTFTEGYIQGVYHAITGELVNVREKQCMISGAHSCTFEIDTSREEPNHIQDARPFTPPKSKLKRESFLTSNIDENKIHEALSESPICGNEKGLIPAFGVLMTNGPADYYSLLNIQYMEEMVKIGLENTAKNMLELISENCAMNSFRCILNSEEWSQLLAPMVKSDNDKVSGLFTLINHLGWGSWFIKEHTPGKSLTITSSNSYTGLGYLKWRGHSDSVKCYCHSGFSVGIMELIYGQGAPEQRYGTYLAKEKDCIAINDEFCEIKTEKV
jgi:hypothetical protein